MDSSRGTHKQRQFHKQSQTFGKIFKGYQVNNERTVKQRHYTGKIKGKCLMSPLNSFRTPNHSASKVIPWKASFEILDRCLFGGGKDTI